MKTKCEPGDFDLIFKDHRGHLSLRHMKDGFCSVSRELFDKSSPKLMHRSSKFEPDDFDLLFKVTKVIENGFRSISEEMFDGVSLNLIHRGKMTRRRPRLNPITLTSFSR